VAERDLPDVLALAKARVAKLPQDGCSGSLTVSGTDHYFGDSAQRLADAIVPFLTRALDGQC
jgi:hypothetical protein